MLMDVNEDGLEDIILATINSNVMAFDGSNFNCIWNKTLSGFCFLERDVLFEYHQAVVPFR